MFDPRLLKIGLGFIYIVDPNFSVISISARNLYSWRVNKAKLLSILLFLAVTLAGLVIIKDQANERKNANFWAYKACDKPSQTSYQASANYAALANSLDSKWIRLSDAANTLAGFEAISKDPSSWIKAPGNDGGSLYLEMQTMYAQFVSECGLTVKDSD